MANYKAFQMKLYGNEDEQITRMAETAGTDKTSFAKKRIFSDENIIILDKSHYISQALIEVSDQLKAARRDGKFSEVLLEKNYLKLCEISKAFVELCKELTTFKSSSEAGDD